MDMPTPPAHSSHIVPTKILHFEHEASEKRRQGQTWKQAASTSANTKMESQAENPEGCFLPREAAYAIMSRPAGTRRNAETKKGPALGRTCFMATIAVPQKKNGETSTPHSHISNRSIETSEDDVGVVDSVSISDSETLLLRPQRVAVLSVNFRVWSWKALGPLLFKVKRSDGRCGRGRGWKWRLGVVRQRQQKEEEAMLTGPQECGCCLPHGLRETLWNEWQRTLHSQKCELFYMNYLYSINERNL